MEPARVLSRVRDVRSGQSDDVARLYAHACGPLIGLLTAIGGSVSDAEEVAQDAFVKLLAHWEKVRTYEDPEAWVRQVAVRLLISRHRRSRVAAVGLRRLASRPAADQPDATAQRVDMARALAGLPVTHRAVLLLHHVLDLPVEAVARELSIPSGTVKSRLARARAAVAPHLQDTEELLDHG